MRARFTRWKAATGALGAALRRLFAAARSQVGAGRLKCRPGHGRHRAAIPKLAIGGVAADAPIDP